MLTSLQFSRFFEKFRQKYREYIVEEITAETQSSLLTQVEESNKIPDTLKEEIINNIKYTSDKLFDFSDKETGIKLQHGEAYILIFFKNTYHLFVFTPGEKIGEYAMIYLINEIMKIPIYKALFFSFDGSYITGCKKHTLNEIKKCIDEYDDYYDFVLVVDNTDTIIKAPEEVGDWIGKKYRNLVMFLKRYPNYFKGIFNNE